MRTALLLAVALFAGDALAYPKMWGPFRPGKEPPRFSVRTLAPVGPLAPEVRFKLGPNANVELVSRTGENVLAHVVARMHDDAGAAMSDLVTLGVYMLPREAFAADFNGDGRDDAAVFVESGGNGLAADMHWLVLFLSTAEGRYATHSFMSMDPGARDFLLIDGHPLILRTSFVYGEPGRDGRRHNYWVYDLFECIGAELVPASRFLPGFPKWVMFSYGENHAATRQLTAEQKRRLWNLRFADAHRGGRLW